MNAHVTSSLRNALYILSMLGPKTKVQHSAEKKCDNGTSSLFSL